MKIKECIIALTRGCNLNCPHCMVEARDRMPGEPTTDGWRMLLEKLETDGHKKIIIFSGGEPTILGWGLYDLIKFAVERFKKVIVQTNGVILPKWIDEVMEYNNFEWMVSLEDIEGMDLKIRGIEHWKNCLRTLMSLKGYPNVTIRTTIYENNDIIGVMELANQLGFTAKFYRLIPVGRGRILKPPTRDRLEFVYEVVIEGFRRGYDCWVEDPIFYLYANKVKGILNARIRNPLCPAGARRIYFHWDRSIRPCPFIDVTVSNMDEEVDVWKEKLDEWLRYVDSLEADATCKYCPFFEFCRGGCRVWAYINNRRGDPNCVFKHGSSQD